MKKLLKEYGLQSEYEYFEMIMMSLINGQRKQMINQYNAMPPTGQEAFIEYINHSSTKDNSLRMEIMRVLLNSKIEGFRH